MEDIFCPWGARVQIKAREIFRNDYSNLNENYPSTLCGLNTIIVIYEPSIGIVHVSLIGLDRRTITSNCVKYDD